MIHHIIDFCVQNCLQIVQTICELISTAIAVNDKFRTTKNSRRIQTLHNPKKMRKIVPHVELSITFQLNIHVTR